MPWKGVTVTEERQRFLEDHKLNYYSVSELAERFGISRKTAHPGLTTRAGKWIGRYEEHGRDGIGVRTSHLAAVGRRWPREDLHAKPDP